MTLAVGTRLGPYEIVAPLGAGGMGEVYRARDARLKREVAIKVLPDAMAQDPEALVRFGREARVVASLAHSNILSLFDVGSEAGVAYAVTELLEGSNLREKLRGGPLPAPEAVGIALQILRGLAAAHDKGVVHRDLKPENVFVTTDGHVKILDFGLAKRARRDPGGDEVGADSVSTATLPGAIVGTMGYMSPEQLMGRPVDQRADLFGFGAVLYELLAGRRAFPGATSAEMSAAILMQDTPAFSSAGPDVPPAFEVVVRRCLEKDPEARFATAHEVLDALREAEASPGVAARRPAPTRRRTIAMLEFENLTGDHSFDWVGRGLPELLGTALARSQDLDVYDPQRLSNLLAGPGGAGDSSAAIFERLRTSGVGRAIVGSILRSGQDIRLQCRVVEVESGRVLHGDASQGAASDDLFSLAARLVPTLQTWLEIDLVGASAGDQWLREITTSSADAYRLYLRGHEAMMASRWRESVGYFEQSLALDGSFSAARVELAACYWNLGDEARTQESLAAAKQLRGRVSSREALQIEMIDSVISQDSERLIRAASSLRELYPENRFFNYLLARGYFTAGRWERCIEVLEPLARDRWTWAWTYVLTASSLVKLGRPGEARRSLELGMEVTRRNPEVAFEYAKLLSAQGDSGAARDVLADASRSPELAETPGYEADIRLELAKIYEAEGRSDDARIQYGRVLAVLPPGAEAAKAAQEGLRRVTQAR